VRLVSSFSRASAAWGNAWNRQLEVAGIAGTSTPCPATSDCQLVNVRISTRGAAERPGRSVPIQRPKAGGFRPQPSACRRCQL